MNANKGNRLGNEQVLGINGYLESPNKKYKLLLHEIGCLELFCTINNQIFWHSNTFSKDIDAVRMQNDGNLVIYKRGGKDAAWATGTNGKNGDYLELQDDGNLVIYKKDGSPVWSTGTFGQTANKLMHLNGDVQFEQTICTNEYLVSNNGKYKLLLNEGGNLALVDTVTNTETWTSGTNGTGATELRMQDDGNLVLYKGTKTDPVWATGTNGKGKNVRAVLENWGDLVLYNKDGGIVWSSINADLAGWMKHLNDNLTLKQICIPGSHDAGMHSTKNWARGLAITQHFSLKEQLEHGCRYFDLRPRFIDGKGLYVYHGASDGPKMELILKDIESYCTSNSFKTETFILSFTDYKDFTETAHHDEFITMVNKHLGKYIFAPPANNQNAHTDIPLKDLRGKIIISTDNDNSKTSANNAGLPLFRLGIQFDRFDEYSNKRDYEDMLLHQNDKFNNFNDHRLFLLNWTLTPANAEWYKTDGIVVSAVEEFAKYIPVWAAARYIWNGNDVTIGKVEAYAREINPKLAGDFSKNSSLFNPNKNGQIVNIINHDFIGSADVLPVCRYISGQK